MKTMTWQKNTSGGTRQRGNDGLVAGFATSDNSRQEEDARGDRHDHLLAEDSHGDSGVFKGPPSERSNAGSSPNVFSISCMGREWTPTTHTALRGGGRGEAAVVVVVWLPGGGRGNGETRWGSALVCSSNQAYCFALWHILYQVVHLPIVDPRAGRRVRLSRRVSSSSSSPILTPARAGEAAAAREVSLPKALSQLAQAWKTWDECKLRLKSFSSSSTGRAAPGRERSQESSAVTSLKGIITGPRKLPPIPEDIMTGLWKSTWVSIGRPGVREGGDAAQRW